MSEESLLGLKQDVRFEQMKSKLFLLSNIALEEDKGIFQSISSWFVGEKQPSESEIL